jgi:putative ABC transport system permease protein
MVVQDLRYAARLLGRNPGFAASAILTLTLGIGMTTAIFSVVDAVLLRPVQFPDPDRLVMVWETDRDTGTSHEPGSWPDYVDFQQRSRQIDQFAAMVAGEVTLTSDAGEPTRLARLSLTHGFLPLVGVTPIVGHSFSPDDDRVGGPRVMLISERLWERVFHRDPTVLGRTLRLDDVPRSVIGVVPSGADFGILQILSAADYSRGFADRDPRSEVDIFLPLQADAKQLVRDTHPLLLVGRLSAGATVASAQDELAAIAADLERAYPENKARGVFIEPVRRVIFGPIRPALLVLLAAVGLVLLIACVNVANLLLARGTGRRREVAVRSALGAGTPQLARQFIVENLLLTGVSAALGIVVAFVGLRLLIALAPPEVPRLGSVAIDLRVLLVALVVTVIVGVVFGALPVLQSRRTNLQSALNTEDARGATSSREGRLLRGALVVSEIALALLLLIGAGLLIKSVWRLQQVDPGFDTSGVLKAEFELPASRYPFNFREWPDIQAIHRFNAALLSRAAALPGVESVAIAGSHPLSAGFTNSFAIVGREAESREFPEMSMRGITPGYFRTVRLRLVRGRLLQDSDVTGGPPVVAINEAAANRLFAGHDPVGQQLAFWGVTWTIVGVVGNETFHGITKAAPIAAYASLAQAPARGGQSLLVRTTGDPSALAGAVRAAVGEIDPALAIFGVEPLAETLSASIGTERFLRLVLVIFAALAVVLAAIGIHGVLSYAVAQRTREIGIRIALGASSRGVTRLVLGQGLLLTLSGLGVGIVLAAVVARSLAGLLFGVQPMDPATFAGSLAVLAVVAAIAIWLPARRAVRVDPILAIRRA